MNDIDICSMALLKLGASSIESFDDGSAEAELSKKLYGMTRDALLVSHPWDFTLREVELDQDTDAPEAGFAFAFQLPPDLLRSLSAGNPGHGRGLIFRISGARLLCDAERVSLTYQRRVDPGLFPPHFVQALVSRLAAELCIPITESTSRAQALQSLAQAELRHARLIDSQQSTPAAVEDFTLLSVRT
ncbi:MAG: hypothetical protein R3C97_01555 [Geminicoccaceae bacterium]